MRNKTIEDYVEIIHILERKKEKVHTNDIASSLGISPASVTEVFQKLHEEGYIHYEKYSGVTLTEKGKKIAINTKRRHDTLKNFLMIIGVEENIANEDACKIEHNVNQVTMDKLRAFVKFAQLEDGCSRWLDHFKHFDKTGEYIICKPKESTTCPVHSKK
jgi:DtxR family Mn-dependent transcriptional regulator